MRVLLSALALAALPMPALAALPVGAAAPDFTTMGAKGGKTFQFSLADALKKGPVVLYFFPAAFTSGCTVEAHEFAEASDDFAKAGATLIGVAADPIDKLAKFSVEECRNKFAVAVASPAMISGYDVKLPLLGRSNRTSFVIARTGRIAFAYSAMSPEGHVSGTLAAVRALKAR
ncbi:peroxiredoxin [Sphingomonas paeninsulae]|uniref:thioredoxin-dependent peroxiredoxin n=1 Tax=Sphingomonas paeninsulae TaxID=2319844 RepID=A0A494TM49_SPHPE|nr:peroxiredoxin [Sphingomonas paeninsulae]AYJ86508.1 peroxiredoxin [Sphingomonas paeninsulae]